MSNKARMMFNKAVSIIAIPILIIVLSLYLPDVYQCQVLHEGEAADFEASAACFTMTNIMQQTLWFAAAMFAIIMLAFEFYKFRKSLSKQQQREGQ